MNALGFAHRDGVAQVAVERGHRPPALESARCKFDDFISARNQSGRLRVKNRDGTMAVGLKEFSERFAEVPGGGGNHIYQPQPPSPRALNGLDRSLPDASCRPQEDAPEGDPVSGIAQQPQVGQDVLDLLSAEELVSLDGHVGYSVGLENIGDKADPLIRPRENRDPMIRQWHPELLPRSEERRVGKKSILCMGYE